MQVAIRKLRVGKVGAELQIRFDDIQAETKCSYSWVKLLLTIPISSGLGALTSAQEDA